MVPPWLPGEGTRVCDGAGARSWFPSEPPLVTARRNEEVNPQGRPQDAARLVPQRGAHLGRMEQAQRRTTLSI